MKALGAASALIGAALASLPATAPLASDPSLPKDGVPLPRRKDPAPGAGDPIAQPMLGTLFNLHSNEAVPLSEEEPSADRFSDLLADRAVLARIDVAPRLLALLRTIARQKPGARIDLVSGYRSEKRNEMMRKKGRHVASHSQHSLGQAVDFRVEGVGLPELVKAIEALKWDGGLGRYDARSDLFVHVDVGPNRRWRGR